MTEKKRGALRVKGKRDGWQGLEGEPGWAVIDVFVSVEAKEFLCS